MLRRALLLTCVILLSACEAASTTPDEDAGAGDVFTSQDAGVDLGLSPDTAPVPDTAPDTATVPDTAPDTVTVPDTAPDTATVPDTAPDTAPVPDTVTVPDTAPDTATVPDTAPLPDTSPDTEADSGGCITPPEMCNGIDDDMDGLTDEDFDLDEDGWTTCGGDCNDDNEAIHPEAEEVPCNGEDDDCDAGTPDVPSDVEIPCNGEDDDCDAGTPDVPSDVEIPCNGEDDDCDAGTPDVPSDEEIPCNGEDDDCDPSTLDGPDGDDDGVSLCAGDCDDTDGEVYPGNVEQPCNGKDDDCDPESSDVPADEEILCNGADDDCDPSTPDVPGDVELLCNGIDDDCDPATLDDPPDGDDDGVTLCDAPPDCDDADGEVFPGGEEVPCNGKDDDCDAGTLDIPPDGDGDGVTLCDAPPDCDDTNGAVFPGNDEIPCDDLDNDCDGLQDEDTHFFTDPDYCGGCDNACGDGEICYLGVCDPAPRCPEDMVRVGDICMDRYEASRSDATAASGGSDDSVALSVPGVIPWYVNPVDIADMAVFAAACEVAGKHLCTASEWQPACDGPDLSLYSWGDTFDPYVCNCVDTFCQDFCDLHGIAECDTADGCGYRLYYYSGYGAPFHAVPTGTFPGCTSEYGAFDINGNVWEIVVSDSEPPDARGFEVRGGAFNCGGPSSRLQCSYNAGWTSLYAGFRCCRAL